MGEKNFTDPVNIRASIIHRMAPTFDDPKTTLSLEYSSERSIDSSMDMS
jgi:hypothetical protein